MTQQTYKLKKKKKKLQTIWSISIYINPFWCIYLKMRKCTFGLRIPIINPKLLKPIDLKLVPNSIKFQKFNFKFIQNIFINESKLISNPLFIYFA